MRVESGTADATGVVFRLVDRPRRLAGVRLVQEIGVPDPLSFDRVGGEWQLRLDRPEVDRLEYLLEITDHNGRTTTITDPNNACRAPGAFGNKSVVEFTGYRPPPWLSAPAVEGSLDVRSVPALDGEFEVGVWTPEGLEPDTPAGLLAVHDGPEYAKLGDLVRFVAAGIAAGAMPSLRVALLDPGDRNVWYAASDDYAAALCDDVLPLLAPTTVRIGVGASLGGLAMLHAHRRHPTTFDALFLQSSSFFTPDLDAQESAFSGFAAVTEFVQSVHDAAADEHPVPTTLTCGAVEENLANNEAMTATLRRLGYDARLHPRRDAHNFVAWRDALDPLLTDLVAGVV